MSHKFFLFIVTYLCLMERQVKMSFLVTHTKKKKKKIFGRMLLTRQFWWQKKTIILKEKNSFSFLKFTILPISSLTLCLFPTVWSADMSEASRESVVQRCRRLRTSEQDSLCGCSVSQPASLWAFRAVPQCTSTEESVCRNCCSWRALTPLLSRNATKSKSFLKTNQLIYSHYMPNHHQSLV